MRPVSMQWFSRLFLATVALGIVSTVVNWPTLMVNLAAHPVLARSGTGFLVGSMLVGAAINMLMWYFITLRASNVARWIWIVLAVIGLPASVGAVLNHGPVPSPLMVTAIIGISLVLNVANLILIFRADSRAWFATRGNVIDPGVFS